MKIFNSLLMGTSLVLGLSFAAAAQDKPETVERLLNISNIFISGKMNKNDASVVLTGQYPNSCYSWSHASTNEKSDEATPNNHVIRAYANVVQGICLMVLTPFNKEVDLGSLSNGEHTIKVVNGDGTYQQLVLDIE